MKTFRQYLSEVSPTLKLKEVLNPLLPVKINDQSKKDIARKAADEVEDKMVKKYQLPTKVV
tara:strand:- start:9 stop:191 length:183 start_codon:yes stop_codon:yes gene_type:complete